MVGLLLVVAVPGSAGAGTLPTMRPAASLPYLAMVGRALPARVLVFVAVAVARAGPLTGVAATAFGHQEGRVVR